MSTKFCKRCDTEFIPYSNNRKFCSDECYEEDKRANAKLEREDKREKQLEEGKPCRTCNKRFTPKGNNSQYCYDCRPMYQKKASTKVEMMDCESCGKEMIRTAHNKRFCSECKKYRADEQIRTGIKKVALQNAKVKAKNKKSGPKKIDPKWLAPRGSRRK